MTTKRFGGRTCLAALYLMGIAGCGGGSQSEFKGGVTVEPQSVSLRAGQPQNFTAEVVDAAVDSRSGVTLDGVSWEVKEGDAGGKVVVVPVESFFWNRTATYTAPQIKGTYHVQVTAKYSNGSKTATAIVEVK